MDMERSTEVPEPFSFHECLSLSSFEIIKIAELESSIEIAVILYYVRLSIGIDSLAMSEGVLLVCVTKESVETTGDDSRAALS